MTKADLVEEVSAQTGVSKNHTAVIVDGMLDAVSRALSEGKHLEIRGFGTFRSASVAPVAPAILAAGPRSWCRPSSCPSSSPARSSRPM